MTADDRLAELRTKLEDGHTEVAISLVTRWLREADETAKRPGMCSSCPWRRFQKPQRVRIDDRGRVVRSPEETS